MPELLWTNTNKEKYGIELTEEEIFKIENLPITEELKTFLVKYDGGTPSLTIVNNTRCRRPEFFRLLSFTTNNKVERDYDSPIISFDYTYKITRKLALIEQPCTPFAISSYTPYPNNLKNKDIKKMDKTQKSKFLKSFNELEHLSLFCQDSSGCIVYWKLEPNKRFPDIRYCACDFSAFTNKLVNDT